MKLLRRVLVTVACVALASMPAFANAQYGGGSPVVSLKGSDGAASSTFAPGEKGSATVTNLDASEPYEVDFAQSPGVIIGSGTSNASGTLVAAFTIPTTATNGSATLTFLDSDDESDARATITISGAAAGATAAPGTASSGGLPNTGATIDRYVGLGVVLLVAGLAILLGLRLRRPESA